MVTEIKKRICSPNGLNLVRLRRYSSHSAANRLEKLKKHGFQDPRTCKIILHFSARFCTFLQGTPRIILHYFVRFCPFLQGPARPFLHYFARSPSDHLSLTICIPPKLQRCAMEGGDQRRRARVSSASSEDQQHEGWASCARENAILHDRIGIGLKWC